MTKNQYLLLHLMSREDKIRCIALYNININPFIHIKYLTDDIYDQLTRETMNLINLTTEDVELRYMALVKLFKELTNIYIKV